MAENKAIAGVRIIDAVTGVPVGMISLSDLSSMIGGGGGGGGDYSNYFDDAKYNEGGKTIDFYHGTRVIKRVDASAFIKDGMLESADVEGGNLVLTFNAESGKDVIKIPISKIFNPNNYYTKEQTDSDFAKKNEIPTDYVNVTTYSADKKTTEDGIKSINSNIEEIEEAQANDLAKITELQGKLNGIANVKAEIDKKANADDVTESLEKKADKTSVEQSVSTLQSSITAEKERADAAEKKNASAIGEIKELVPEQASGTNKLADKDFVNSSIATNTAEFKGTFNSLDELNKVTADANDYGFVKETDAAGNTLYKRYKYVEGEGFVFEYELNNSSFTSAQWAAINSNITADLTQKLSALPTAAETATKNELDVVETLAESVNQGLGESIKRIEALESGLDADKTNLRNFKQAVESDYVKDVDYNKDKETLVSQIMTKANSSDVFKKTDFTNAETVSDFTHVFVQTSAGVRRITKDALISLLFGSNTFVVHNAAATSSLMPDESFSVPVSDIPADSETTQTTTIKSWNRNKS